MNELLKNIDKRFDELAKKFKPAEKGSISMYDYWQPNYSNYFMSLVSEGRVTLENQSLEDTNVMTLEKEYETNIMSEQEEWKKMDQNLEISETADQHPHFEKIIKKLGLAQNDFELRLESRVNSERPDFIFIKESKPKKRNPLYASFVVELMVGDLDDGHKGKLLLYNEEVLNSNPCRQFIISVLTNLNDMVIIKSEPASDNIIHQVSKNINFWERGVKYIQQMHDFPETAGYDEKLNFYIHISRSETDPPIKYQIYKLLGSGLTARVYSLVTCAEMEESDQFVAKIFKRWKNDYFDREQAIMDKIARRYQDDQVGILRKHDDGTIMYKLDKLSDKFIQRVAVNSKNLTIIYTPRGEKLRCPITLKQFEQMFSCMRELYNEGIIHRDITPSHFLTTKATAGNVEKIFIIDFGSAAFVENNLYDSDTENYRSPYSAYLFESYRGSVQFAATVILRNLMKRKPFEPSRRHDLESFVKMFYMLYMKDNEAFGYDTDIFERIGSALKYWEFFEKHVHSFWQTALKLSRGTTADVQANLLDSLYDHLKNFIMFRID